MARTNRFRLNSMKNEDLAEFLFSKELALVIKKYGGGPKSILSWLKEPLVDSSSYSIRLTDLTIESGNVVIIASGFKYTEVCIGDVLETSPIDGITYKLNVIDIIYPLYENDEYKAKVVFEDADEIPLKALPDIVYKGCKLVSMGSEKRELELYHI